MTTLEIKKYGDPVLRKKSEPVGEINDEIKSFAKNLLQTMYFTKGVGLAAPQVGVSLRICVIDLSSKKDSPIIMINPEITNAEEKEQAEEGCLSFPAIYENVTRYKNVSVVYTDEHGREKKIDAQNYLARAVQHEIDHLDAKLFIDYLPDNKRKNVEKEIKRRKKAGKW